LLDKYWENQEVKYDYNEEIKVRTGSHKKKFIASNISKLFTGYDLK
jgi:hypothetical protein